VLQDAIGATCIKRLSKKAHPMGFAQDKPGMRTSAVGSSSSLGNYLFAVVDTSHSTASSDETKQFSHVVADAAADVENTCSTFQSKQAVREPLKCFELSVSGVQITHGCSRILSHPGDPKHIRTNRSRSASSRSRDCGIDFAVT
jgi:hypothetical protein